MFNLYDNGSSWEVHAPGMIYSGNFVRVITFCMLKLDFTSYELELAVSEMVKRDDNAAHFGVNRTFMWSFRKEEKDGRQAG